MPQFKEQRGRCYPVAEWERVNAGVQRALETGASYKLDVQVLRQGVPIWVTTRGELVRDAAGQIVGLRGTVQDITERKRAEEALRESRAKLQAAFASMTEAIFIADAEGRLVDYNDEFVRYHRFKDREECSRTIADCPKYLEAYLADGTPAPLEMWAMPRALRGESSGHTEYRLRRKDTGETWWGSYSFAPVRGSDGKIAGGIVAARETTRLKEAEAALRTSEERFRVAQDLSPDGFSILRPIRDESGRVVDFTWVYENPTAARFTGQKPEALVGRRLLEVFPGPRRTELLKGYREVAESARFCGDDEPDVWGVRPAASKAISGEDFDGRRTDGPFDCRCAEL
jgi:PAS domain-containing protein